VDLFVFVLYYCLQVEQLSLSDLLVGIEVAFDSLELTLVAVDFLTFHLRGYLHSLGHKALPKSVVLNILLVVWELSGRLRYRLFFPVISLQRSF
jgi:hypothetical protein